MRTEADFLGEVCLAADCLYGVQTARALENFGFSGRPLGSQRHFVEALALVKAAAARANRRLGTLDQSRAGAIEAACRDMRAGELSQHLVVDMMEGSGGTSINMNVNEVAANRALQHLGHDPGHYAKVHPNDHVNRSQSTNDVIPTAIKMACRAALGPAVDSLERLAAGFRQKQAAFASDLRLGRTCLQDAQPMTLGQAFSAYAEVTERLARELRARAQDLLELPLGATAIGTGFGAPRGYRETVIAELGELTGESWRGAANLFDGLANADVYARLSAEVRGAGLSVAKIGNDLQILSSGPAGGIGELKLPPVQAGSSIMPGKVNPVLPMAMCQIGFAVAGYDAVVAQACQQGQLEINPYEPVIALHLFDAIRLIETGADRFLRYCVAGIEPDRRRMAANLEASSAVATALLPVLGYGPVSELVRDAQARGTSFAALADERGVLSREDAEAAAAKSAGL